MQQLGQAEVSATSNIYTVIQCIMYNVLTIKYIVYIVLRVDIRNVCADCIVVISNKVFLHIICRVLISPFV